MKIIVNKLIIALAIAFGLSAGTSHAAAADTQIARSAFAPFEAELKTWEAYVANLRPSKIEETTKNIATLSEHIGLNPTNNPLKDQLGALEKVIPAISTEYWKNPRGSTLYNASEAIKACEETIDGNKPSYFRSRLTQKNLDTATAALQKWQGLFHEVMDDPYAAFKKQLAALIEQIITPKLASENCEFWFENTSYEMSKLCLNGSCNDFDPVVAACQAYELPDSAALVTQLKDKISAQFDQRMERAIALQTIPADIVAGYEELKKKKDTLSYKNRETPPTAYQDFLKLYFSIYGYLRDNKSARDKNPLAAKNLIALQAIQARLATTLPQAIQALDATKLAEIKDTWAEAQRVHAKKDIQNRGEQLKSQLALAKLQLKDATQYIAAAYAADETRFAEYLTIGTRLLEQTTAALKDYPEFANNHYGMGYSSESVPTAEELAGTDSLGSNGKMSIADNKIKVVTPLLTQLAANFSALKKAFSEKAPDAPAIAPTAITTAITGEADDTATGGAVEAKSAVAPVPISATAPAYAAASLRIAPLAMEEMTALDKYLERLRPLFDNGNNIREYSNELCNAIKAAIDKNTELPGTIATIKVRNFLLSQKTPTTEEFIRSRTLDAYTSFKLLIATIFGPITEQEWREHFESRHSDETMQRFLDRYHEGNIEIYLAAIRTSANKAPLVLELLKTMPPAAAYNTELNAYIEKLRNITISQAEFIATELALYKQEVEATQKAILDARRRATEDEEARRLDSQRKTAERRQETAARSAVPLSDTENKAFIRTALQDYLDRATAQARIYHESRGDEGKQATTKKATKEIIAELNTFISENSARIPEEIRSLITRCRNNNVLTQLTAALKLLH